MDLKVIQSFRIQTLVEGKGQYFGWGKPTHGLISLSLSLWQLNNIYNLVLVYTDVEGKAFLESLNCLDVEIKILPDFLPKAGSLDKLYACADQFGPFVHVDSDVFIQKELSIPTSSDFLFVNNNDYDVSLAYMFEDELARVSGGNETGKVGANYCLDTSLLGGSHGRFFKSYFNEIEGRIPMLELCKLRDTEMRFWIYSFQLAKFAEEQRMLIKFNHKLPSELQYPFLVSKHLIAQNYCKLHDSLKLDSVTIETLYKTYLGRNPEFVNAVLIFSDRLGLDPVVPKDSSSFIRTSKALFITGFLVKDDVISDSTILTLLDIEILGLTYYNLINDLYLFEKQRIKFLEGQRLAIHNPAKKTTILPKLDKDSLLKMLIVRADNICLIESYWDWAVEFGDLKDFNELKIRYNLSEEAGEHVTLLKYDSNFDSLNEINLLDILDIALLDTLTKPRIVADLIADVFGLFVNEGSGQQDLSTVFEELAIERIAYCVAQQFILII